MALLDLAPGVGLRINGLDWTVEEVRPQAGSVVLARDGGQSEVRPIPLADAPP
jgi:hypothetical protein